MGRKTAAILTDPILHEDGTIWLKEEPLIKNLIDRLKREYRIFLILRDIRKKTYQGSWEGAELILDTEIPAESKEEHGSRYRTGFVSWTAKGSITLQMFDCILAVGISPWVMVSALQRLNGRQRILWLPKEPHHYLLEKDCAFFGRQCNRFDKICFEMDEKRWHFEQRFRECHTPCCTVRTHQQEQMEYERRADEEFDNPYEDTVRNYVTVGDLVPGRRMEDIPLAASQLKQAGEKLRWFVIGEGPVRSRLIYQMLRCEVCDEVILLGNRDNIYPYIKYADAYMTPADIRDEAAEAALLLDKTVGTFDMEGKCIFYKDFQEAYRDILEVTGGVEDED